MSRTDVLGNERRVSKLTRPSVALPDTIQLTPIKLPRPHLDRHKYITDIQDERGSVPRAYSADDVLPGRVLSPFPEHLRTRRMSSIEFSDLTSPSQNANRVLVRSPRGVETVPTTTDVPATLPRARLGTVPATGTGLRDGSPAPLVRPTARTSGQFVMPRPEVQEDQRSVADSIRFMHERALYRNPSISYQRFLFSLTKYPAIVLIILSLSTLHGRGEGIPESSIEQGPDVAALATGGFILVAQVFLLHQHYNCYKKARIMSILYHIAMVGAFCGAMVSFVYCCISFGKLKKHPNSERGPCKLANPIPKDSFNNYCLSTQDRIVYMSVILGADLLIACLAIATFAFGTFGQALMKKRLDEEYQKNARDRAHANQAFHF